MKLKTDMRKIKANLNSVRSQFSGLRGVHPGLWPQIPRRTCYVMLFLFALFLGWYFYLSGQVSQYERGKRQEETHKAAYRVKIKQAINLESLRVQKKLVAQYVSKLEKQLPSKAEMDALLSDINQAGVGRGLQFELFKPGQVVVKDYYAELQIHIKVTGNYHDIASFTSDIAHLPRIVTLNNIEIEGAESGGLTLSTVAKTFRYLDEEELAAQRAEKKAKKKKKGRRK